MRYNCLPWAAALVAVLLSLASGCGPGGALAVHLRPEVARPNPGVVLFICDGCSLNLVQQGCRDGWCPNIRQRFVEGGTRVDSAVSAVPSITYPILTTFATGLTPARHGVLANEWFDPGLRLHRKYAVIKHYRDVNGDFCVPTIYERMQPKVSVSIQNAIHRGVTKNVANWAQSGVRWYFRDYTAVDKLTATTLELVARWANDNERWPDLLVCYFPGVDSVGHRSGPESERYRWAIEHLDYQLGRVCDWLEAEGLLETTYLVFVADHGFVPVRHGNVIDLSAYLRKQLGRHVTKRALQGESSLVREHYFDRFDTVLVTSATRFAMIYFRGELGWDDQMQLDAHCALLESPPEGKCLWDIPGVDLVAYLAADDEVELRSPRGTARVVERPGAAGAEYRYVPLPNDVFGYTSDPVLAEFVASGYHTSREWLDATCGQEYPDIVPHLVPLLRARRSGDVVLFAAHGYSFGREKGGHGGIHCDEMRIPVMFAGPGIEPGRVLRGPDGRAVAARVVDLAPTLLEMLGCELPDQQPLEGVSLWPALCTEPSKQTGLP
jgi:arylsulfatase A-like enzyme